jgi:hypothetical protein
LQPLLYALQRQERQERQLLPWPNIRPSSKPTSAFAFSNAQATGGDAKATEEATSAFAFNNAQAKEGDAQAKEGDAQATEADSQEHARTLPCVRKRAKGGGAASVIKQRKNKGSCLVSRPLPWQKIRIKIAPLVYYPSGIGTRKRVVYIQIKYFLLRSPPFACALLQAKA